MVKTLLQRRLSGVRELRLYVGEVVEHFGEALVGEVVKRGVKLLNMLVRLWNSSVNP